MANVVIFKPGQVPQLLPSVNTPDYSSDPDVLVNPDLSQLSAVPQLYWKRSGDKVLEMSTAEKAIVDAAITAKQTADKDAQASALDLNTMVLAKALVKAGVITKAALVTAIKQVS